MCSPLTARKGTPFLAVLLMDRLSSDNRPIHVQDPRENLLEFPTEIGWPRKTKGIKSGILLWKCWPGSSSGVLQY
jgi:hypothetical protein